MKSAKSTIQNFLPSISKGKKDSIALMVLYNLLLNYLLKRSITLQSTANRHYTHV